MLGVDGVIILGVVGVIVLGGGVVGGFGGLTNVGGLMLQGKYILELNLCIIS